jgi:hypothetical protein
MLFARASRRFCRSSTDSTMFVREVGRSWLASVTSSLTHWHHVWPVTQTDWRSVHIATGQMRLSCSLRLSRHSAHRPTRHPCLMRLSRRSAHRPVRHSCTLGRRGAMRSRFNIFLNADVIRQLSYLAAHGLQVLSKGTNSTVEYASRSLIARSQLTRLQ